MKKHHLKLLVGIFILCILLTGCTDQPGKSGMTVEDLRKNTVLQQGMTYQKRFIQ
ncbi:hypothetical protein SAMN02910327_01328 [Peptostreptococcaceae bacterium pGA-8]|nr:hypothetical protein SAMN02910327_01328 [Peptostreptococcaceae bacterium pGA-8]